MARDQHRSQKRGDGLGYAGYKHQKGDKVIAIIDNNGYVLAPVPVAPVNETDMVLLPQGLKASPSNVHLVLDFLGYNFRSRDVVTVFVGRSLCGFLLGTARMLLVTS